MSEYNFENLDAKKFEQLSNALCAEYIARGTTIFGSGTDGGREATFQGRMKYPTEKKPWNGYLVVQCKQKEKLSSSLKVDADWAITKLDEEMEMYKSAVVERKRPEYFLFITNVELSARLNTGGKDRFAKRLDYWVKELGMKAADFWDRDKLGNLLDTKRHIAEGFGFLHAGDVVHRAAVALGSQNDVNAALYVFLQRELRSDQFVNLAQAGHTSDEQPLLARVFVDLQASTIDENGKARSIKVVDAVQKASDRPISPGQLVWDSIELADDEDDEYTKDADRELSRLLTAKAKAKAKQNNSLWKDPSRFVFIGGPGQGKSTLTQYLSQRHRAALLTSGRFNPCEAEVEKIIRVVEETAVSLGVGLPKHPRLPFAIELQRFANKLAAKEVFSVLDYIVQSIHERSGLPFNRKDAEQLLADTPWMVAFDGLDEVPAVSNRKEVVAAVQAFLDEARAKDADLLVIATTRPQGFGGEFSPNIYNHLTLHPLTREEALAYAKKLVEAKYQTRIDRQELILQRLERAAGDDAIARLMVSPLQVTIMALLVELVGNLPRERYVLFQRYYDIIYQREQERGVTLSDVLVRHRTGIEILHDQIGLQLQIEAETANTSGKPTNQSRISTQELEGLVISYLTEEGFEGQELARTKDDLMRVAIDRLVFIVSFEQDSYGFEVRSLQEFSAARALMRGRPEYNIIKARIRAIATAPYWLNTMLFAVGQAFSLQDNQRCDIVVQLCNDLNNDEADTVLFRSLAGSRLALDILEDGVAVTRPVYRRSLLDSAFRLLTIPHEATAIRIAELYAPAYDERFRSAAQAAVGSDDTQLSLFVFLATLAAHQDKIDWAKKMMKQLWPSDLETARQLLPYVVKHFTWEIWQRKMVSTVARQSSLSWVAEHLSRYKAIKWVSDSKLLKLNNRKMTLKNGADDFSYSYFSIKFPEPILARLAKANPVHPDWLPFILGKQFLISPSAETLAEALDALAQSEQYVPKHRYHYGLPWQLTLVLNYAESREEIAAQAQRAREGKLGTTADWVAAEKRWDDKGFNVADFAVFSDADWPFTPEIAKRGIQPTTSYSVRSSSDPHTMSEVDLMTAFATATCTRMKPNIAAAFFFMRSCTTNRRQQELLKLPIATLVEVVQNCRSWVSAATILSMLEPDLDWVDEVKHLDFIGSRISWLVASESYLLTGLPIKSIVNRLLSFLSGKKMREGILRLLAGLVVTGTGSVLFDDLPVEFDTLSPECQVEFIAIAIFSQMRLPVAVLVERILALWSVESTNIKYAEMGRIIERMIDLKAGEEYYRQVMSELLARAVVPVDIKQSIIKSYISQTQFRVSGLGDENTRRQLELTV